MGGATTLIEYGGILPTWSNIIHDRLSLVRGMRTQKSAP